MREQVSAETQKDRQIDHHVPNAKTPPAFSLGAEPIQRKVDGGEDPFEVPWADTKVGEYEKLSGYDKKTTPRKMPKIDYVILHRTAGTTMQNSIDAHFEVGLDGTIKLANRLDQTVIHAGSPQQLDPKNPLSKYKGMNGRSLGIEFVGAPYTIKNKPTGPKDTAGIGKMRTEIQGLDLSPQLKDSLVSVSDSALYSRMSGVAFVLYEDINARQKMAAYEMQRNLQQDYPGAEFLGHENVSPKKIGEGANIQEFLETIGQFNTKLKQVRAMAPDYWSMKDASKISLENKAETAMGQEQFFAQFYAINARLDRIVALVGGMAASSTATLIPHLVPDNSKVEGMDKILGEFKNYVVAKEVLTRSFGVNVSINTSQDWSGGEDVFIVVNGVTQPGEVTIADKGSHTFVFSNSLLSGSLKTVNQIDIMDRDPVGANDVLMSLQWNPISQPEGATSTNANLGAKIAFTR